MKPIFSSIILILALFSQAQTTFNYTPYSEYSNFLTSKLIEQTCTNKHKEICKNGGVKGGVQVKVCYFTPPGWEYKFAYCQVNYIDKEITEFTHFLFYPNQAGNITTSNFRSIEDKDLPCIDCQLKNIKLENNQVVGEFFYLMGPENETFNKTMDYNFKEMTVSWKE